MKIKLQSLIGFFTIALLAVSAVRAQSIYTTPSPFVTIAGMAGNLGAADGTNGAAQFYSPEGIAEDTHGNLYVVDNYENTIRKITPAGTNWAVTTIAGTPGLSSGDADGTNGAAVFDNPVGIAMDANSNLYVGEYTGSTIRKITPVGTNWVVTTIAGQPRNYNFADGTNGNALFNGPLNLTVDTNGNLYVADSYNCVVRKIAPVGTNWVVTTLAGQPGMQGYGDGTNSAASFDIPYGLALDGAGNLYVSDTDNGSGLGGDTIRKMTPAGTNWVVSTIAGIAATSGSADGTNDDALFNSPLSIAADSANNLYVADYGNSTIRKISPSGTNWVVSTIAGVAGQIGSTDGTGTNALFYEPWGATVDSTGNLFVTDAGYATVRLGLVPLPPSAAFSGAPTSGVVPMMVTFTNLSSNATNYVWNFGDGNMLSTGSNTNVTDTYTNAGSYTVILTAYGPGGISALTNSAYIVVTTPSSTNAVPDLTVRYAGGNTVVVSWPNTGNFLLQTNGSLTTPNWANYGGAVTTSNGTNSVTVPLPASGSLFFRLVYGEAAAVAVPNLMIGSAGLNSVVVSWPDTGAFTLQTNGNLTTPNWGNYGGTITTGNGTNSAAIKPLPGSLFFRLTH
jgi:PKD repeat protein